MIYIVCMCVDGGGRILHQGICQALLDSRRGWDLLFSVIIKQMCISVSIYFCYESRIRKYKYVTRLIYFSF